MKLSELKPCVLCNGRIAPVFYQVHVSQMMVIPSAVNQTLGVNMVLSGNALGLAEALSPSGDNVTITLQEQTALVCQDCFLGSGLAGVLFEDTRPGEEEVDE